MNQAHETSSELRRGGKPFQFALHLFPEPDRARGRRNLLLLLLIVAGVVWWSRARKRARAGPRCTGMAI